jgi:magnesium-protoporphyrin O-methyltransferase
MSDRRPCDCGCANVFGTREAEGDLKRYRRNGPDSTTKALIEAIVAEGIEGATLLDVGGGIGAIAFELLDAGAARAQSIDATDAYIAVERQEAARRGVADRVTARVGDFVALAPDIEPADVVTLDKVVCCYVDMPALVGRAADRARRMVGLVFPRETWWNRVAGRLIAAWSWLTRSPVRWRLHPPADIDRLLAGAGFERHDVSRDFIWHVVLYRRRIGGVTPTNG